MAPEENNRHQPDMNEFFKSLQNDSPQNDGAANNRQNAPESGENNANNAEAFPFTDEFDIDAFISSQGETRPEKTLTSVQPAEGQKEAAPAAGDDFGFGPQNDFKEQSIKNLEEKIAELESRFEDANKEKSIASVFTADFDGDKDEKFTPGVKADDEFFHNISNTIENLKGSLENIVSARLRYEENLIRQDQTLISRLREKTTRLKAINIALNSEVKRAKNERLESLRKSAEQTKELLSLRMQLSKVEEKARHGDFKLAGLEQQLALAGEQRASLDGEILKIRGEKLESLQKAAGQAKEIMALRLDLAKTEEKFKQEETQNNYLKEQLREIETRRAELDNELYSTRSQREEANRKTAALEREAQILKTSAARAQESLNREAFAASALREKILSLETELQRHGADKAALMLKNDEALRKLQAAREQSDAEISRLKAAQLQELEVLKTQKAREEQAVSLELKRAEEKYRQEETFVNTLKLQIEALRNEVKTLAWEKAQLSGGAKAADLAKEMDFIKQNHLGEIEALRRELKAAQDKFAREEAAYGALAKQLADATAEKNNLTQEMHKLMAAQGSALRQNDDYLAQIRGIKEEHNNILAALKADLERLNSKSTADERRLGELKLQSEEKAANFTAEIENLKRDKAAQAAEAGRKQGELSAALERAQATARDNESLISTLKSEIAAVSGQKLFIDEELKKANGERYEILKKLEEKSKEFETYRLRYEGEISALREEKAKEAGQYRARLEDAALRLRTEENLLAELKGKIAELQAQKLPPSAPAEAAGAAALAAGEAAARKALEQTDEIISLKNQLAKAENRFLQDTVLINQLKEQFKTASGMAAVLEGELQKLREETAAAKKDLAAKEEEIGSLKASLSKTQERLQQEESSVKQLQEHTSKLKAVNFALDREVKKVQAEKLSALKKSAEQAKEILALREQLTKAESGLKSFDFENGIISIRKEYEAKVVNLETRLKDASARFAEQVKEIQNLKADNTRLKSAEEEKIKIEGEYKLLSDKSSALEAQLKKYESPAGAAGGPSLAAAKTAALTAQIVKIKRERTALEQKLSAVQPQIDALTRSEKAKTATLGALKARIAGNDRIIEKLKKEIIILTAENKNLKADAEITTRRERTLYTKITEVEGENKKLETMRGLPPVTLNAAPAQRPQPQKQQAPPRQNPLVSAAPAAQTRPPAARQQTLQQPAARKDNGESPLLKFGEPGHDREIIDVKSDNMDLSLIFGGEEAAEEAAAQNDGAMQDLTGRSARVYEESDMPAQDHAPRGHGIARRPLGRVPRSFREDAAYTDFLNKTKSVLNRIKWSLFNEQQ
ncbi:MAG: hypothetical protein LBL61_00520 [Elusimicrobiota bacterium]|jgi:chromosome segregation ATPase|nr:hypothetical protein [Elusimicrobiota bacterium]